MMLCMCVMYVHTSIFLLSLDGQRQRSPLLLPGNHSRLVSLNCSPGFPLIRLEFPGYDV